MGTREIYMRTHRFDELPVVEQRSLVLDVVARDPGLDLVP